MKIAKNLWHEIFASLRMKIRSHGIIGQFRSETGLTQQELADMLFTTRSFLSQVESGVKSCPDVWVDLFIFWRKMIERGKLESAEELSQSIRTFPSRKTLVALRKEIHYLENRRLYKLLKQREDHLQKAKDLTIQYYMYCFDNAQGCPNEYVEKDAVSKRGAALAKLSNLGEHNLWILEAEIEHTRMTLEIKKELLRKLEAMGYDGY